MPRLLVLLLALAPLAGAEPKEEKRVVIALMDLRSMPADSIDTDDPVHQVLEMPLNYLGMVVHRHDIADGPPPARWVERARAVLTYFDTDEGGPDWLWPWMESLWGKVRFVHCGDFGPLAHGDDGARLRRWLARMGLGYDGRHVETVAAVRVAFRIPTDENITSIPSNRPSSVSGTVA